MRVQDFSRKETDTWELGWNWDMVVKEWPAVVAWLFNCHIGGVGILVPHKCGVFM